MSIADNNDMNGVLRSQVEINSRVSDLSLAAKLVDMLREGAVITDEIDWVEEELFRRYGELDKRAKNSGGYLYADVPSQYLHTK